MMRLRDLPDDAKVYNLFARNPDTFEPFADVCEKIMRGTSPLTPGQRELIGTFVSALNACPYCHDVHNEAVKAYGIDGGLAKALRDDIATADVEEKMKPLLALVKKSTENAYKITDADFDAAYAAGWDDDGIHDAIIVSCLFNFMNRLVSTFGIEADDDYLRAAGPRLRDEGYAASLEKLGQQ